jgi:histidinol dehydrogenase
VKINRYLLGELGAAERAAIMRRAQADLQEVEPVVAEIVAAVRERGDAALIEYTAKLDRAELQPGDLRVSLAEFDDAEERIPRGLREAIELAVSNVRKHHQRQLPGPGWMEELSPGVISGERVTPIASAGLYVPRGKGSFPSVVMMLGIPAALAGVPRVAMCTPPGPDGTVDAASLMTARLCGIREIFKVGGAQAIAAMAYGTETIAKVDKIVGPGNRYVAAARRLVYGTVDPGAPAGPSESIVLCDDMADAEVAARELLVEAEHGPDSAALLVTDSLRVADAVIRIVPDLVATLPEPRKQFCETVLAGFGGVVITGSVAESVRFVNDYAPEHLRVLVREPFEVLHQIVNAGEVLLGERTSIAFGNFVIGVNAILPTGGFARSYSCTGVDDFLKRSSFAYVSSDGAALISSAARELAQYEGFPAHAEAADFAGRGRLPLRTCRDST